MIDWAKIVDRLITEYVTTGLQHNQLQQLDLAIMQMESRAAPALYGGAW